MLCAALLAFLCFLQSSSCSGMTLPTIKMCLPTSFNIVKLIAHTHAQRTISQVTWDPIKMPMRTDHLNHFSESDWLVYQGSPPVLCYYAPGSHPPLLTALNQITPPFHTYLISCLHIIIFFLFLEIKPEIYSPSKTSSGPLDLLESGHRIESYEKILLLYSILL